MGGIINNIIMCADDFPEAPNERIDITSSPWLRIGDPIDLEDPSTIELETIEAREQEFMARMDNLDKQQIRPLATLYVLKQMRIFCIWLRCRNRHIGMCMMNL